MKITRDILSGIFLYGGSFWFGWHYGWAIVPPLISVMIGSIMYGYRIHEKYENPNS